MCARIICHIVNLPYDLQVKTILSSTSCNRYDPMFNALLIIRRVRHLDVQGQSSGGSS